MSGKSYGWIRAEWLQRFERRRNRSLGSQIRPQAALKASATGSRAARNAGKNPPNRPMMQAQTIPVMISVRVTVS